MHEKKTPNMEIFWAGDFKTGRLNVSIKCGTLFGVSNAFAERIAHSHVTCDQLIECDLHADTGDMLALFEVAPCDWADFAYSIHRKVMREFCAHPEQWDQRGPASRPN